MMWIECLFLLCFCSPGHTQSVANSFRLIIGVYSPDDTGWEEAIDLAWRHISHENSDLQIEFFYFREDYGLSVEQIESVRLTMLSKGISAIVGPYHPLLELVADYEKIPYITTSIPPERAEKLLQAPRLRHPHFCYHMMPSVSILNDVILDLLHSYHWDHSAVLYNQPQGLTLIGELMTMPDFTVNAWKIENSHNETELLNHLLTARGRDMRTFLVVCDSDAVNHILAVALRLSMMSRRYHWLILNMDSHSIDYDQYAYTMVNFSMFQLYTEDFTVKLYDSTQGESLYTTLHEDNVSCLQYSVSVDTITILLTATENLITNMTHISCPPYCSTEATVKGEHLNNYILQTDVFGETGRITFDGINYRDMVLLNIMLLSQEGLCLHGTWEQHPEHGPRLKMSPFNYTQEAEQSILGRGKARIVTIVDPPFVMFSKDHESKTGNDRFQGCLIDLIATIAERLQFQYELYLSPDGNYGSRNPDTNEWNGMINELIQGKATMCLGAISITSERETVVDFTKPYKQKMFNILMRKPKRKSSIFQFLWPLSTYVWILTVSSMVVVGFLLFVMDHFSPNSSHKSAGRFTLKESIWFIYGSLVGVGTEIVPRTVSGRLLSGAWWFFGLILVSSYTANLAAFLTVTKIETPIKSMADLAGQTKIKYGTVKNTYANSMFRSSKIELIAKMWTFMDKINPDSMVDNFSVAVEKVKTEDYAFIWDQPINDYIALHDCETISLGTPFDEKGYGIGVPPGASYRDTVSQVLLELGENGYMQQLQDKWWSGGTCEEFKETSTSGTKELQLENVAGVFVVVAMGALLGLIACMFEFTWIKTRQKHRKVPTDDTSCIDRDGSSVALKNSVFHNHSMEFGTPRRESRL